MADISRYKGGACKKMQTGGVVRATPLRRGSGSSNLDRSAAQAARTQDAKDAGAAVKRPRRMAMGGPVQTVDQRPPGGPMPGGPMVPRRGIAAMPTPIAGPPSVGRAPMGQQHMAYKGGGEIKPPRGPYITYGDGAPVKTTGEALVRRSKGGRINKKG